jgi:hypothetical protein
MGTHLKDLLKAIHQIRRQKAIRKFSYKRYPITYIDHFRNTCWAGRLRSNWIPRLGKIGNRLLFKKKNMPTFAFVVPGYAIVIFSADDEALSSYHGS